MGVLPQWTLQQQIPRRDVRGGDIYDDQKNGVPGPKNQIRGRKSRENNKISIIMGSKVNLSEQEGPRKFDRRVQRKASLSDKEMFVAAYQDIFRKIGPDVPLLRPGRRKGMNNREDNCRENGGSASRSRKLSTNQSATVKKLLFK